MAKTKLLYLHDPYLNPTTAKVTAVNTVGKQTHLVLNQTIFYPQGGGQPADHGLILAKSGQLQITHTKLDGTKVLHQGNLQGELKVGDEVTLQLDWDRRYQNMQAHTAGHILHEAVKEAFPEFKAVKACHGIGNECYVSYEGFIDATHQNGLQLLIDQIINNREPITFELVTPEEIAAKNIPLPPNLPTNKPLRLITIGTRQPIPDGGTLLQNTQESFPIKISEFTYDNGHTTIHYTLTKPKQKAPQTLATPLKSSLTLKNFEAQLQTLKDQFLNSPSDQDRQTTFLGKKGLINQLSAQIPQLALKDRKHAGRALNQLKNWLNQQLAQLNTSKNLEQTWLDVTLPGQKPPLGHLHPVTQAIADIQRIFESIGFTRVRYPEIDWDYYAFESLNMPSNHPARDEWETFFIEGKPHPQKGKLVLTPHTSNGQVREMERVGEPPIRMLNIAKCYRRQQDVTHTAMFHQFEGLVIDRGIGIPHLKGTLDYFARHFYGPQAVSRIRPFMFKFTEPSFEVDFSCIHCQGKGCRFCKSGWHEVGGAGMVHPNVLKAGGINPNQYTGFAFGWGIERVYTLKEGLNLDDIRPLYQNDLNFLSQF